MPQLNNPMQLDANETSFFRRQIEYVKAKTYDAKYKNLKAKMLIPVSNEVPSGSSHVVWYSYDKVGIAKIIADYANDFPRADAHGTEQEAKVRGIGSSYGYNVVDIRRSQRNNTNLETRKANAAKFSTETLINKMALVGDSEYNINGLINYPGITEATIPTGSWASATAAQMVADVTALLNGVSEPTNGVEVANMVLFPLAQYNILKNTQMPSIGMSVLTYLKENNPGVTFDWLTELKGAGAAGADRMIAYVRDPDHLTLEIPQNFEQFDADKQGMEYVVPCYAECAGTIVYYPQSVAFGDGI